MGLYLTKYDVGQLVRTVTSFEGIINQVIFTPAGVLYRVGISSMYGPPQDYTFYQHEITEVLETLDPPEFSGFEDEEMEDV